VLEPPTNPNPNPNPPTNPNPSNDVTFITPAGDPVNSPVDAAGGAAASATNAAFIPDGANEFTFSNESTGKLTITLKAKVKDLPSKSSAEQAQYLFDLDSIGESALTWKLGNEEGKPDINGDIITATAYYTGLPKENGHFGLKKARVKKAGNQVAEASFEVFFPRDASNHPEGQANSPNWFHYWRQVHPYADLEYGGYGMNEAFTPGLYEWNWFIPKSKTKIILNTPNLNKWEGSSYGVGVFTTGIDRFISLLLHEEKHVLQIAAADALLPQAGTASTPWRFGWSFNKNPHNHWSMGTDNKPGKAGVDDDGNGKVDDLVTFAPGELGLWLSPQKGGDILLCDPQQTNWPKSWVKPQAFPDKQITYIECDAIRYSDREHKEHDDARNDWANPGKNHQTIDKYDD
jgi:hypothetical protein